MSELGAIDHFAGLTRRVDLLPKAGFAAVSDDGAHPGDAPNEAITELF